MCRLHPALQPVLVFQFSQMKMLMPGYFYLSSALCFGIRRGSCSPPFPSEVNPHLYSHSEALNTSSYCRIIRVFLQMAWPGVVRGEQGAQEWRQLVSNPRDGVHWHLLLLSLNSNGWIVLNALETSKKATFTMWPWHTLYMYLFLELMLGYDLTRSQS